MTAWLAWFESLFSQSDHNPAWPQDRLEYSFAVSGQTTAGETVLKAPEYLEGHLDWYSFEVGPKAKLGAVGQVPDTSSLACGRKQNPRDEREWRSPKGSAVSRKRK